MNIATQNIKKSRNSFKWAIRGYRPDVSTIMNRMRRLRSESFDARFLVSDETRWIALYMTDDDFTLQFLIEKTGYRTPTLIKFCRYYGVDLKKRNFIIGENN